MSVSAHWLTVSRDSYKLRILADSPVGQLTGRLKIRALHQRIALKERDRLDMRRVRKHVHHAGRLERITVLVYENAGVAGETSWMAGNV